MSERGNFKKYIIAALIFAGVVLAPDSSSGADRKMPSYLLSGIITSRFGESSSRRTSKHTGLDIGASTGTKIKACADGTVTFSGYKGSYGYMVVINHGNGIETYYAHCSKLYANVGDKISQGDVIAAVGNTGNSTGPHLHLEIRVNGIAYNPQNYLY